MNEGIEEGGGCIAEDAPRAEDEGTTLGNGQSTIATGVESDNYFTTLAGELTDEKTGQQPDKGMATRTEAVAEEMSEEPSIK